MNKHTIFKELFELPQEDTYEIEDLLNMLREARAEFRNVGVEFSYEAFKQWFQRAYGPFPASLSSNNQSGTNRLNYEKLWKIIEGDNLDIIEEAAKDKGLL